MLANGSSIPDGDYFQRIAVLKPWGNPENVKNWDVYVIPFTVESGTVTSK